MAFSKLLALDLGGVCVRICPDRLVKGVQKLFAGGSVPPSAMANLQREMERAYAAFAGNTGGYQDKSNPLAGIAELCGALERGEIDTEYFLNFLVRMTGNTLSAGELLTLWNTQIGDPIASTFETTQKLLERGWQVCFFSNTSVAHLDEVRRKCPICTVVTDGAYSFEAGALKPDPAIYRFFETKFGRKPDYFFDDREENVAGAKNAGWNAVRYTSPEDLDLLLQI